MNLVIQRLGLSSDPEPRGERGGGWKDSHIKRSGMLVVSLGGVNKKILVLLNEGVHDETPSFLTVKVSFRMHSEK